MRLLALTAVSLFAVLLAGCGGDPPKPCQTDAECGAGKVCQSSACVAAPVVTGCTNGATRPCGNEAVGVCKKGVQTCVAGDWASACAGEVKPSAETCNGLDDDCDGDVDEGVSSNFYVDNDGDGYGSSSAAAFTACTKPQGYSATNDDCNDTSGTGAAIHPGALEVCDSQGVDEDCDGIANAGCSCTTPGATQPCCSARGTQTCEVADGGGTSLSACSVSPTAEVCNGVDDDCDGQTDEMAPVSNPDGGTQPIDGGVALSDGTCAVGLGVCAATGTTSCASAALVCSATPGTPATETCNGLDDDCDGQVDEGCNCTNGATRACYSGPTGTAGVGACRAGTQTCVTGNWAGCMGEVLPVTDTCNNTDDDCDGQTDEGFGTSSCGVGACARTVNVCVGGATQTCTPGAPTTEVCNGADDNCNGQTDEGFGTVSCGVGACARSLNSCVAGVPQTCVAGTPATEVCNGADDNCNGQTDEGLLIACSADPDGDRYASSSTTVMLCPDSSRTLYGFCPVGYVAPASSLGADCSPNNGSQYRFASSRADADNDTACTGPAVFDCVGTTALPGRRFASDCNATDDCNDGNATLFRLMNSRTDSDGDSYCTGAAGLDCVGAVALPGRRFEGACSAPDDCNDASAAVFRVASVRVDSDNDAWCVGATQAMCIGSSPPAPYRIVTSCQGDDCRDTNTAAGPTCLLTNHYTTSYHGQTCPQGATTFSVTPLTFCPAGFYLSAYRAQIASGFGFCTAASQTSVTQTCNFLEGSNCRVVGDCTAL